jgi:phospholipase C
LRASTYAVKPGDFLQEEFPLALFTNGRYFIEVISPNGFYRYFTGDAESAGVVPYGGYERHGDSLTGNVELTLQNSGHHPRTIVVEDHSYGAAAITKKLASGQNASIVLASQASHGWYDFTVKIEGDSGAWRFSGRVENGKAGYSDPLIGANMISANSQV